MHISKIQVMVYLIEGRRVRAKSNSLFQKQSTTTKKASNKLCVYLGLLNVSAKQLFTTENYSTPCFFSISDVG